MSPQLRRALAVTLAALVVGIVLEVAVPRCQPASDRCTYVPTDCWPGGAR